MSVGSTSELCCNTSKHQPGLLAQSDENGLIDMTSLVILTS